MIKPGALSIGIPIGGSASDKFGKKKRASFRLRTRSVPYIGSTVGFFRNLHLPPGAKRANEKELFCPLCTCPAARMGSANHSAGQSHDARSGHSGSTLSMN